MATAPPRLVRRSLIAAAAAMLASTLSAQDADAAGQRTRRAPRAGAAPQQPVVKVPRRSRTTSAHRAYLQAKAAGIIAPASASTALPGNVKEAVTAGIVDSQGAAGGLDNITLITSGSGKSARSYFAGNRYSGVLTRKTGETFEVHGPFRVDADGTLEGAAPVVSSAGVDLDALSRETGLQVERIAGRGERPTWFHRGPASRSVVATGDAAVQQFHAEHMDRSIHRTASARALNALSQAGHLRDARMIRFSQSKGGALVDTVHMLVFKDRSGRRVRIIAP